MLDVEYLLERPRIDRAIVYRYKTGVLRRQMMAALRDLALSEKRELVFCEPLALIDSLQEGSSTSLMGDSLIVCDWKGLKRDVEKGITIEVLNTFAALADDGFALFVPEDGQVTKDGLWSTVEAKSFLIEEPEITPETLLSVLHYLERSTDLADDVCFSQQPGFVESFSQLLLDGCDLSDLTRAFDDRVLTCTDPGTNTFDARPFEVEKLRHRDLRTSSSLLRDLVARGGGSEVVALVTNFDERQQQGWSAEDVLVEVHRVARRLLRDEKTRSSRGERRRAGMRDQAEDLRQDRRILLWAALVLAWDGRLRQGARSSLDHARRVPSVLMTALDQFGRMFVERADRTTVAEGLVKLWPELEMTWAAVARRERDRLGVTRDRTVRALVGRLASVSADHDQRWRLRLLRGATEALEAAGREGERRAAEDEEASNDAESER